MDQPTTRSAEEGGDRLPLTGQSLRLDKGDRALENEQQLAGVGTLAAAIAQELANQLSIVKAAGDSLRNELQNDQKLNESAVSYYLNLIERNTFRSAQIVALMQEFASPHEPQIAITDIDAILRDTSMLVARQFRDENNIEIAIAKPADSRSIVCDHNRIVQLLLFLLQDARQALPESGGQIDIKVETCKNGACAEIDPLLSEVGADLITIQITTLASPVPAAPHVENGRLRDSTSGGAGLGLRIARDIAGQHDGHILLKNNNGPAKGTVVIVVLPVRLSL